MIFKFTKITDATNTIVGPTNTNAGKIYSIDSMLIANNHTAGIIAHVTMTTTQHGVTTTYDLLKNVKIAKGFSLEVFDDSFLYPDSYDIKVQLDNAAYSCDVLVRATLVESPTYNE
tara:strand:+ start:53 stop:400 length:348 start_codon:yes stop_codon:yes gene_type:complete